MTARAYRVVELLETVVAEYTGARYGIAVESCTAALFLSCLRYKVGKVTIPAKTYVSVPQAIIHAGGTVAFEDLAWSGTYQLKPYPIWDAAKQFTRFMYRNHTDEENVVGTLCLSFHAKKILAIGRGGMILTNDPMAADWFRKMRYDGRAGVPYAQEDITLCGWNMYMTPEQAARGLVLMDMMPDYNPDQQEDYPDLRKFPVFFPPQEESGG